MEQQRALRFGRGTTDWVYIVRCIYQITGKMKRVYVLFIDITTSFDHVDRELMFKTVCKRLTLHQTDPTGGITIFAYTNRASSNSG